MAEPLRGEPLRGLIVDYGGVLSILPAYDDPIEASAGMLKGGASLTRAVVAEHVKERGRDRKR